MREARPGCGFAAGTLTHGVVRILVCASGHDRWHRLDRNRRQTSGCSFRGTGPGGGVVACWWDGGLPLWRRMVPPGDGNTASDLPGCGCRHGPHVGSGRIALEWGCRDRRGCRFDNSPARHRAKIGAREELNKMPQNYDEMGASRKYLNLPDDQTILAGELLRRKREPGRDCDVRTMPMILHNFST